MAHQSPMMSIPKKTTEEVDWTTPIRTLIAQSYGENPDNYAAECASLQRCRQDAVRGAGSDITARDLLYKYFGQLELLELRFSEIRVNFPWRDAFTNKLITQTSIAYEKASILFQIAVTHSAIAAAESRSDPEGLKRAFHYFRTCAGMLNYINENFLHAPSTDLSREVVKFLVGIILAQATEVFFEKCTDEKKGHALVSKIGAQAASMYTSLSEEVKEFMGKGIFDRNWVSLIQIKAKYFTSVAQYYRAQADAAAGKHGEALSRYNLAESLAKEASRLASSFASTFVSNMSPNLPADAGPSMQEKMKTHHVVCTERRNEAQRENDLIYNAILPAPEALPALEKTNVATPIHIHDVYGAPDVQKTIGQDFFIKLVPLSVHESASVYSEEKAKLVRGEVEKAEGAEGEAKSALDGMGVKEGLARFKAMAEGEVGGEEEVPMEVRRWKEDITLVENREGVESIMVELNRLKDNVKRELDGISRDLEIESKDCEMMRVKYEHLWTQPPSAGLSKSLRQDLKSHAGALEAAATSDQQVTALWGSVKGDIQLLQSHQVEAVFKASTEQGGFSGEHLLDLDVGSEVDDAKERAKIGGFVEEIEERLGRLNKISHERNEVLKDLKEKIQTDDVSHLLLLNRRNSGVEPTLFAAELEKFRPYQQRLSSTIHHQELALQELATLWKGLKDHAGRGAGARKWEDREKRKNDTVRRFAHARDGYMEVRDGLAKGQQFYTELTELTRRLRENVRTFVSSRTTERENLSSKIEIERKLSSAASPPPLAAKPSMPSQLSGLGASFSSMSMHSGPASPPPSSQWQQSSGNGSPAQYNSYNSVPLQQQQQQRPFNDTPSQFTPSLQQHQRSFSITPPSQFTLPQQQQQQQQRSFNNTPPSQFTPQQQHQAYGSSPPPMHYMGSQQPQQQQQQQQPRASYLPPPPSRPAQSQFIPAADPYANLGMFNPAPRPVQQNQNQMSPQTSAPQPPPQAPYSSQQPYRPGQPAFYPPAQQSRQSSFQFQPQQQQFPQQQHQQRQPSRDFGFPPPPPVQTYSYGGSPLLPSSPQQQQQPPNQFQGFQPSQSPSQGYSQGFGR